MRPGKLEIWVANADGGNARQVTYLDAASFAPSFFPDGNRIVFSSNYGDAKGREFDLWAVDLDGSRLERITWTPGFDGFPLFSPDGTRLAFSSNRNQGKPGETNVFVARWVDRPQAGRARRRSASSPTCAGWPTTRASGRGIGTPGLEESARWLAERFREVGLEPAGQPDGHDPADPAAGRNPTAKPGWFHEVAVPVAVEAEPGTRVVLDGKALARESFRPVGFSSEGAVEGEVVAAGYGITASDLGVDDYKGVDAKGKIVVVRRFTPGGKPFDDPDTESRYSDLRLKAWNAREHGARALLVVDLPAAGTPGRGAAARAPGLDLGRRRDPGAGARPRGRAGALPEGKDGKAHRPHRAEIAVDLAVRTAQARNVVGVLRAGAADRLPGAVLLGAHYDHLGLGGRSSLAPGVAGGPQRRRRQRLGHRGAARSGARAGAAAERAAPRRLHRGLLGRGGRRARLDGLRPPPAGRPPAG